MALQDVGDDVDGSNASTADQLRGPPDGSKYRPLLAAAMQTKGPAKSSLSVGVINSLEYLRDMLTGRCPERLTISISSVS